MDIKEVVTIKAVAVPARPVSSWADQDRFYPGQPKEEVATIEVYACAES